MYEIDPALYTYEAMRVNLNMPVNIISTTALSASAARATDGIMLMNHILDNAHLFCCVILMYFKPAILLYIEGISSLLITSHLL